MSIKKALEEKLNDMSFASHLVKTLTPIYGDLYHWKSIEGLTLTNKLISETIVLGAKYFPLGIILYYAMK